MASGAGSAKWTTLASAPGVLHHRSKRRAVGIADGSWFLFALERRGRSLEAMTGPCYALSDNGKRVFDRRYGVARDLLREKLRLLVVDRRC